MTGHYMTVDGLAIHISYNTAFEKMGQVMVSRTLGTFPKGPEGLWVLKY